MKHEIRNARVGKGKDSEGKKIYELFPFEFKKAETLDDVLAVYNSAPPVLTDMQEVLAAVKGDVKAVFKAVALYLGLLGNEDLLYDVNYARDLTSRQEAVPSPTGEVKAPRLRAQCIELAAKLGLVFAEDEDSKEWRLVKKVFDSCYNGAVEKIRANVAKIGGVFDLKDAEIQKRIIKRFAKNVEDYLDEGDE